MVDLNSFSEKVVTYNIALVSICPNKDLLGIVTDDDTIVVKRISNHPKKIVSLDETIKVVAFSFKCDGESIAIGSSEGLIKVYTLSSTELQLYAEHALHSSRILSMEWYTFAREEHSGQFPISKYIASPASALMSHGGLKGFTMMLSQETSGFMSLVVNGIYPLAFFSPSAGRPMCSHFASDLNKLHYVTEREGCYLESFNSCVLNKKSKEIQEIAEIFALSQNFFQCLSRGIKEVVKEGGAVFNSFIGRYLNSIEDALEKAGNMISVEELLSQCAGTGVISPCLSKFIKEELQNTKAITQYEEKLNIQVKNCQIVLIQVCKNSITGLLFYLNTLINYSKCPTYAPFALSTSLLQELVVALSNLLHNIIETMALLASAHANIINTLHWLHNWNIKLGKEDEQAEASEEWPVNLKQLIKYLESHSSLYFADLSNIIKTTLLDHFQEASKLWKRFTEEIPLTFPRYFLKTTEIQLSSQSYANSDLAFTTEEIIIAMFTSQEIDVFAVKGDTVKNYKINLGLLPKYLKFHPDRQKFVIAGDSAGESQVAVVKINGESSHLVKFAGEEITTFVSSPSRALSCLITNERTLRFFDLEDI